MPVASYGWVGRVPTDSTSLQLFRAWTKHRACRSASLFIKQILYGAKTHLDIIIGCRLVKRVSRLWARQALIRSSTEGCTWQFCSSWLHAQGWQQVGDEIKFRHPELAAERSSLTESCIGLSDQNGLPAFLHSIRVSWRRCRFLDWLYSSWHEARELLTLCNSVEGNPVEFVIEDFHQSDCDAIRKATNFSPAVRSTLLGSLVGDAWLGHDGNHLTTCCACTNTLGSFHHIMYECGLFPHGPSPPKSFWIRKDGRPCHPTSRTSTLPPSQLHTLYSTRLGRWSEHITLFLGGLVWFSRFLRSCLGCVKDLKPDMLQVV